MITQFFGEEKITKLTKTGATTLQLAAGARLRVGGLGAITKSALNLDLSANGFGGLDTGSITANSLYYIYAVISGSQTGLVASLSPNGPTGFLQYKKVGALYTDGNGDIIQTVNLRESVDTIETSYIPVFQGFGTPSNVLVFWRRDQSNLKIRGSFDVGTPTAVTARLYLPSGLLPDSNKISASHRESASGFWFRDSSQSRWGGNLVVEDGSDFLLFGAVTIRDADGDGPIDAIQNVRNGSNIVNGGEVMHILEVSVPIKGWDKLPNWD